MKQTISFVTLGVTDIECSRRFYRALGWTESPSSQAAVAFFQVGCIAFALFGRESLAEDANSRRTAQSSYPTGNAGDHRHALNPSRGFGVRGHLALLIFIQ